MSRLVDVYPYRRKQGGIQFLIFKRAADVVYARQWRMIGGKVNGGEKFYEAALREFTEETGLEPALFWTIPSVNQFYDHQSDTVHRIPAFGAEVDNDDEIELNHEHTEYRWITKGEVGTYISWPEQQRLIHLVDTILTNNGLLKEWIIKP